MSIFAVIFFIMPILGIGSSDWNGNAHETYWFFLASWSMSWLCSAVLREHLKEKEKK